ncbi:hypothetical protein LD39_05200 [Halobacillus sp. BBL2006]|nr:hypothetical protein LD39_05200 [Halobacillus sp. BBL2006]
MYNINSKGLLLTGNSGELAQELANNLVVGVFDDKPRMFFYFEGTAYVKRIEQADFPIRLHDRHSRRSINRWLLFQHLNYEGDEAS